MNRRENRKVVENVGRIAGGMAEGLEEGSMKVSAIMQDGALLAVCSGED